MQGGEKRRPSFEADQPAPAVSAAPKVPLSVALAVGTAATAAGPNPILAAATPFLAILGRLRLGIVEVEARPLMRHALATITDLEKTLLGAGVSAEAVRDAQYALCATADDIVQNLPGTDRACGRNIRWRPSSSTRARPVSASSSCSTG